MLNTTTAAKISLACSTMSAMLIGFLGNSIIIFLFVFNKGLRNGTNMQLVNVAACYMTTAVLHMPACLISISSGPHPPFSPLFCKLLQFTNDLIYIQICFATCALAFYQCFSIKPFLTLKRSNSGSQTAVVNNNRLKYLLCLITWVLSTGASVTSQLFNADCSDVFARYSNFIISWSVFIGMFVLCSFITLGFLVMTYSRISRARSLLPQRMKMVDTVKATCTLDRFSKSVTTSLIIFVQSFFCSTPLAVYRVFAGRHIIENRYFYSLCLVQLFFMQICFATCALAFYQCFSIKPFLTLKRSNSGSQTAVVNNNRLKYLLCLITWVLSTGASVTSQLFNADCSDVFARYSNFIISWSVFIGMFVLCSFITLGFLVMTYSRISRARSLLPQRMKMVDTVKATCTLDRFSKSVTTSLIIFVQSFFCSTPLAVYRVFAGRHIIENRYFYSLCLVQLFFMQAAIFPVLVAYRSRAFRMGFRQLFCAVVSTPLNNDAILEELYDSSPRLIPYSKGGMMGDAAVKNVSNPPRKETDSRPGEESTTTTPQQQQNGHCLSFDRGDVGGLETGQIGGGGGRKTPLHPPPHKNSNSTVGLRDTQIKRNPEMDHFKSNINLRRTDILSDDDEEDEGVGSGIGTSYSDEKVFVEITENEVKIHHHTRRLSGDRLAGDNVSSATSITRNSVNNCSPDSGASGRATSPHDYTAGAHNSSMKDDSSISRTLSDIHSKETYI